MFEFFDRSISFFKKTIDSIGKTTPEVEQTPTQMIQSRSTHPVAGRNDIHQLPVIDQRHDGTNTGVLGNETCGYHAFRNALVLLQTYGHGNGRYLNLLNNQDAFLKAYKKWEQLVPTVFSGDRDIDIATLHEILAHHDAELLPPQNMAQSQQGIPVISLANAVIVNDEMHYSKMGGPIALETAANLWQVAHSPDVNLTHAFVIGIIPENGFPHWVTAVLRQEGGHRQWIVMDSYANQTEYTHFIPAQLERLLQNSDEAVNQTYEAIASDLIKWRSAWVNPQTLDVTEEHRDDKQVFLTSEYKEMGIQAFQFMKKCQWLERYRGHEADIKHLTLMMGFYATHLPDTDPQKESIVAMYEELKLVVAEIDRPKVL